MEPKKIKKLVLNQETISTLSEKGMNNFKGGGETPWCTFPLNCTFLDCPPATPGSCNDTCANTCGGSCGCGNGTNMGGAGFAGCCNYTRGCSGYAGCLDWTQGVYCW